MPKIIVREHLTPVFELGRTVRVICREGSLEELITQLAGHKLDVVLADEPSTSALRVRTFNQRVSTSNVVLCAVPPLVKRLAKDFPSSLDGAPAILPVGEMSLRRQLEHWFDSHRIRPRVVAEVEDTALLTDLGAQGLGFVPVYSAVLDEIARSSRFQRVGIAKGLRMEIFAITAAQATRRIFEGTSVYAYDAEVNPDGYWTDGSGVRRRNLFVGPRAFDRSSPGARGTSSPFACRADTGLRHMQDFTGSSEAAFLCDRPEIEQMMVVKGTRSH